MNYTWNVISQALKSTLLFELLEMVEGGKKKVVLVDIKGS